MAFIVALAALAGGMFSLQGCGSSGDDTPATPTCDYESAQGDHFVCPGHGNKKVYVALFNDLVSGDVKEVTWAGNVMNISGPGLAGAWSANATLDEATCSGDVDFSPFLPEGPVTVTVYSALAVEEDCKSPLKYVISFTNEDRGAGEALMSQWVEADAREHHVESTNVTCPTQLAGNFGGVQGDLWYVEIDGTSLTLRPSIGMGNFTFRGEIDASDCSATVDFGVPGTPNPPDTAQVRLAEIRLSVAAGQTVREALASPIYYILFSDTTGSSGRTGPIDQWTQRRFVV